jgi:ribosomal protein S27E
MGERNVKEIIVDARSKKGTIHEIIEKRKANMEEELESSQIERMLLEEKERIRNLQNVGKQIPPSEAHDFVSHMFSGRKPEEIKEILDSLDETHIEKLALVSAAMNNNQLGLVTQLLNKPDRGVKETIELVEMIVKMNQRPVQEGGITLQGIAAIMKEIRESQGTTQPKESTTDKYLGLLMDELKMARQENQRERESRLEKEIAELKNRPSAMEELGQDAEKYQRYRRVFGGADQGAINELALKKEEMQQTERIENKKLEFEQEKWRYEKENEGKTIDRVTNVIKTIGEGPFGKVIENIGSGAGERIRAGKGNASPMVRIQCPNCYGQFSVNPALPKVTCIHCGATLEPAQPTPPPEVKPQPETRTESTQATENAQPATAEPPS